MSTFENYLQTANQAKTPGHLFDIFADAMGNHGYDKILFALLTDHRDLNLKAGVGVIENFPDDWMKYYFENSFDKIDPVPAYAVHQAAAFEWSEIPKKVNLEKKQIKCLNLGIEAGLHNGIGVALRGPNSQVAGISLASSEKKDACHFQADLITAYCNHFYIAYKRLHEKKPLNPKNIVLTNMEREVLTWAATGKSDQEIADVLGVSQHTVNTHLRSVYKKTDANCRMLAVVRAMTLGLITP